jgi:hypothetical protein
MFQLLPFVMFSISIHIGFKSVITSVISFHYQNTFEIELFCSTSYTFSNEQTHSAGDGHGNMALVNKYYIEFLYITKSGIGPYFYFFGYII